MTARDDGSFRDGAAARAREADGALDALRLLGQRCEALGDELRRALAAPAPRVPREAAGRWVVTGVGASEGPARVLAALLRQRAGRCAPFVPLSAFAGDGADGGDGAGVPEGDVLVVVSHGLSPNARLALARRRAFGATVLVTGAQAAADDEVAALAARGEVEVYAHAPASEPGLLLRTLSPAVATLACCRLANAVARSLGLRDAVPEASLARVPDAVAAAPAAVDAALPAEHTARLLGRVAFVTTGADGPELSHGLRWKWLEGLGREEPPAWDVLQVAHGPFQSFFDEPITLFALGSSGAPAADALFERLAQVLRPPRHRLVLLRASLPGAAALFEHDAMGNHLLLRALAARPRDLARWPGKGLDSPLYDLGRER